MGPLCLCQAYLFILITVYSTWPVPCYAIVFQVVRVQPLNLKLLNLKNCAPRLQTHLLRGNVSHIHLNCNLNNSVYLNLGSHASFSIVKM